jgi:hypothetical protein
MPALATVPVNNHRPHAFKINSFKNVLIGVDARLYREGLIFLTCFGWLVGLFNDVVPTLKVV